MTIDVAAAPETRRSRIASPVPAVVALVFAAAAALHLNWSITSDTAWLITVCERMLGGARLYADISEPNPPMSVWLYMPWVWLAPRLGLAPETLVIIATLLACLSGIALSARTLSAAGLIDGRGRYWIVSGVALALLPMLAFTQREHFAVALALPMLAAIAARVAGRDLPGLDSALAGVCAGVVMAIKPHFGAAFLLPLLYAVALRRTLRPLVTIEAVAAAAVVALYAVAFVALHPDYFTDMLPLASAIYLPTRMPWDQLLQQRSVVLAGLCLGAWLLRSRSFAQPFESVLLLGALGFFAAYLVQGRGYDYHMVPSLTLVTIGFGLSLRAPFDPVDGGAVRRTAAAILSVVVIGLVALTSSVNVMRREADEIPFMTPLRAMLEPLGSGLKIAVLSRDITVGNPLHRLLGATLVNRGPMLWIAGNARQLCWFDRNEETRRICDAAIERERVMLREDLRRDPPDVVIAAEMGGDWLAFAREDAETAAILDGYKMLGRVEVDRYRLNVLVRSTEGARP